MLIQHSTFDEKIRHFLNLIVDDTKNELRSLRLNWNGAESLISPSTEERRRYIYVYVYRSPRYIIDGVTEEIYLVRLSKRVGKILRSHSGLPLRDVSILPTPYTLDTIQSYDWGRFRPRPRAPVDD